jgi:hypothetical protein
MEPAPKPTFEGADATFFARLVEHLPDGMYEDHEEHVLRMLLSSPYPGSVFEEFTLIRTLSQDQTYSDPTEAAKLISMLVGSLVRLQRERLDARKMEAWFFDILGPLATHVDGVVTLAAYETVGEEAQEKEEEEEEEEPLTNARAPFGSDASASDERDEQLSRVQLRDDVTVHSSDEVYHYDIE